MYSAKSASWISGLAGTAAAIAGKVVEFTTASVPTPPPLWFMATLSLAAGAFAGAVMTIAVRVGLHLARCGVLNLRYVLGVPGLSLLIVGFVVTRPMETHAAVIDVPSANDVSNALPPAVWAVMLSVALIPGLVSFVAGRLARRVDAA
jgi:hypothetical protein